ncbi:MAG: hypothetical protein Q9225_002194 [Loekoesia sp. 1 TL-2023]
MQYSAKYLRRDVVIAVGGLAVRLIRRAKILERFLHLISPRPHNSPSCATASPANLETDQFEWVHDRYDDDSEGSTSTPDLRTGTLIRRSPSSPGAKLRVDNLHYDLTEDDLEGLFTRIGPINSLALRFDRAGRSSGTAFVTYRYLSDARLAIREFDGANAHGQPIRLTLLPIGPSNDARSRAAPVRNPFDTIERPPRSLFDRIDDPRFGSRSRNRRGRSRSRSPGKPRRSDVSKPAPEGVDRYVPPSSGRGRMRSRSPRRRRDVGGRGREGRERHGGRTENPGARPKKTQEELDKEMEDYWGPVTGQSESSAAATGTQNGVAAAAAPVVIDDEDVDMGVE